MPKRKQRRAGDELNERETKFLACFLSPKSKTFGNATRSAIAAGFGPKGASVKGCRLLGKAKIQRVIAAWHEKTESDAVSSIQERKEILSSILRQVGRGKLSDYAVAGKDGVWITYDKDSPNQLVVRGAKSHTDEDDAVISEIKLAPLSEAIAAANALNDMDGLGKPEKFQLPSSSGGAVEIEWSVVVTIRPRNSNGTDGASNINPDQIARKA
jgi:hypothetical protein